MIVPITLCDSLKRILCLKLEPYVTTHKILGHREGCAVYGVEMWLLLLDVYHRNKQMPLESSDRIEGMESVAWAARSMESTREQQTSTQQEYKHAPF